MNYFEFRKEIVEAQITLSRRSLHSNYALFILNMSLCIFYSIGLYLGQSNIEWLTGIAIGMTGAASFWMYLLIWECRRSIKDGKEEINYLNERTMESITEDIKNNAL